MVNFHRMKQKEIFELEDAKSKIKDLEDPIQIAIAMANLAALEIEMQDKCRERW